MVCLSRLVIFYFKEKFCFSARVGNSLHLRDVHCRRPCQKYYISGYIWHKSFIQTVKCSFSNQINVYQSFCGALLTFFYFLCFGSRVGGRSVTCVIFIVSSVPKTLSKKLYLRLYLTQIVH